MALETLNVGYGSVIVAGRIIGITNPDSAPVKRNIEVAMEHGKLLDLSMGRRVRSVIVLDNETIVLSAVAVETLYSRLKGAADTPDEA